MLLVERATECTKLYSHPPPKGTNSVLRLLRLLPLPLPRPWHWEDKISPGVWHHVLAAFEEWRKALAKKGKEETLTPPPEPGTPRGLPCGTPGHTAVEAHVRLL